MIAKTALLFQQMKTPSAQLDRSLQLSAALGHFVSWRSSESIFGVQEWKYLRRTRQKTEGVHGGYRNQIFFVVLPSTLNSHFVSWQSSSCARQHLLPRPKPFVQQISTPRKNCRYAHAAARHETLTFSARMNVTIRTNHDGMSHIFLVNWVKLGGSRLLDR